MIYLEKVDNWINSLRNDWEEIRDTTKWFQNKTHTLKRGSDETLNYRDKWVTKAGNKITAFKRKRACLA